MPCSWHSRDGWAHKVRAPSNMICESRSARYLSSQRSRLADSAADARARARRPDCGCAATVWEEPVEFALPALSHLFTAWLLWTQVGRRAIQSERICCDRHRDARPRRAWRDRRCRRSAPSPPSPEHVFDSPSLGAPPPAAPRSRQPQDHARTQLIRTLPQKAYQLGTW